MKKLVLLLCLSLCGICAHSQKKNLNPLRILIRDSVTYDKVVMGNIEVPAVASGMMASYKYNKVLKYPVRIALDPGHIAGNWDEALIEGNFIQNKKKHIKFYESQLTMATCLLLKEMLESNGFSVMITRDWGASALGYSWTEWYKNEFKKQLLSDLKGKLIDSARYNFLLKADKKTVFTSYFRLLDLKARVAKINEFKPDITAIVHYNTSEFTSDETKDSPVCQHNYSAFFIPGAFTVSEMNSKNQHEDLFRLLSTDALEKSALLSSFVADQFKVSLGIPPIDKQDTTTWSHEIGWYKKYISHSGYPGVLGRNLALTRAINSPLVYGEPFLQNNAIMIEKLNKKEIYVAAMNMKTSSLILSSARCYYSGILRYLREGQFSVVFE